MTMITTASLFTGQTMWREATFAERRIDGKKKMWCGIPATEPQEGRNGARVFRVSPAEPTADRLPDTIWIARPQNPELGHEPVGPVGFFYGWDRPARIYTTAGENKPLSEVWTHIILNRVGSSSVWGTAVCLATLEEYALVRLMAYKAIKSGDNEAARSILRGWLQERMDEFRAAGGWEELYPPTSRQRKETA